MVGAGGGGDHDAGNAKDEALAVGRPSKHLLEGSVLGPTTELTHLLGDFSLVVPWDQRGLGGLSCLLQQ